MEGVIAIPIGQEIRMAEVGASSYFEHHPTPVTPQDLTDHVCINIRLPTYGGLFAWEFDRDDREIRVCMEGQVVVNHAGLRLQSALDGRGLAYVPEDTPPCH